MGEEARWAQEAQRWEQEARRWDTALQGMEAERAAWARERDALLSEAYALRQEVRALLQLGIGQSSELKKGYLPSAAPAVAPLPIEEPQPPRTLELQPAATPAPAAPVPVGPESAAPAPAAPESAVSTPAEPSPASGPPPDLKIGDDNIEWIARLHTQLAEKSYYVDNEDLEDWVYGDSTQNAVLFFQGSCGLPETGVVDGATWGALGKGSEGAVADTPVPAPDAPAPEAQEETGGGSEGEGAPQQGQQPPDGGLPPDLKLGNNDIKWVARLHARLAENSYYVDDEDEEDWVYGESTQNAVFYFQSGAGLQETGVVDAETWAALGEGGGGTSQAVEPTSTPAAAVQDSASAPNLAPESPTPATTPPTDFPVLLEGDGGRAVKEFQRLLLAHGFSASDEELEWWQFGSSTEGALKTFQACSGLPETGIVCVHTWSKLVQVDAPPPNFDEAAVCHENEEYCEDLAEGGEGAVYLVGEQRWARTVPKPRRGNSGT